MILLSLAPHNCPAQTAAPRLNAKEQEFVSTIERKLATKLNSKNNPGDKQTWYVLIFRETAVAATGVMKGRSLTVNSEDNSAVVQGKHAAALAIARFMVGTNGAVDNLKPPANQAVTQVETAKQWDFRAFSSEAEANVFVQSLQEEKPAKKSRIPGQK